MQKLFSTCTVSRDCGISVRQLYYWELIGLVRPHYESFGMRKFRRYTAEDIELLKNAKALLDEGFTLQAVKERMKERLAAHAVPQAAASSEWISHASEISSV